MSVTKQLEDLGIEIKPMKIQVQTTDKYQIVDSWVKSRPHLFKLYRDQNKVVFMEGTESEKSWTLDEYYQMLADMDLALGYTQMCTFTITASTAFREFLYQFEEKARWAETSRQGIPNINLCSSDLVEDCPKLVDAYKKFNFMKSQYDNGKVSYDKFRENMPLSFPVTFQLTTSVKQFVKYLAVFYKHVSKYLPNMWEELYCTCHDNDIIQPWLKNIPKYMNCYEANIHYMKDYEDSIYKKLDKFTHCKRVFTSIGKIGKVLFAQLIRHENVVTIGYINYMQSIAKLNDPICGNTFDVAVSIPDDRLIEIVKKRCRYFASNTTEDDPNSWLFITKRFAVFRTDGTVDLDDNKHLFEWFDEDGYFHPELMGKYDVDEDSKLKKGYKIYLPDAFSLEWKAVAKYRIIKDGNSFLNNLFLQHFTKGYIKDNPNNARRKRWLELNPDMDFDKLVKDYETKHGTEKV